MWHVRLGAICLVEYKYVCMRCFTLIYRVRCPIVVFVHSDSSVIWCGILFVSFIEQPDLTQSSDVVRSRALLILQHFLRWYIWKHVNIKWSPWLWNMDNLRTVGYCSNTQPTYLFPFSVSFWMLYLCNPAKFPSVYYTPILVRRYLVSFRCPLFVHEVSIDKIILYCTHIHCVFVVVGGIVLILPSRMLIHTTYTIKGCAVVFMDRINNACMIDNDIPLGVKTYPNADNFNGNIWIKGKLYILV